MRQPVLFSSGIRTLLRDAPKIVLEVGAGSGHLLNELSRRFPEAAFVAVEPGRGAAARTAALGFQVWGDVEGIPEGSCDVIVATAVLDFLSAALDEAFVQPEHVAAAAALCAGFLGCRALAIIVRSSRAPHVGLHTRPEL